MLARIYRAQLPLDIQEMKKVYEGFLKDFETVIHIRIIKLCKLPELISSAISIRET